MGPLLRKRQLASTADVVCTSVETMLRRRCTVEMLRAVEAVRPGTLAFSVRAPPRVKKGGGVGCGGASRGGGGGGGGNQGGVSGGSGGGTDATAPPSPRRIHTEVVAPAPAPVPVPAAAAAGAEAGAEALAVTMAGVTGEAETAAVADGAAGAAAAPLSGRVLGDMFRLALVELVGACHDSFLEGAGLSSGDQDFTLANPEGQVREWHAQFDVETVPMPPLAPLSLPEAAVSAATGGLVTTGGVVTFEAAAAAEAKAVAASAAGNGSAISAVWKTGDGLSAPKVDVTMGAAAAARAGLGGDASELPLSAIAAVMKVGNRK